MKPVYNIIRFFLSAGMFLIFAGMTDCGDMRKVNTSGDPNFIALKDGQGNYEAVIIDELARIEVREVSFSGATKVGGILYEENDAAGLLEIESLIGKTIKVVEDNFRSVRYPEKNLFKAKIIGESPIGSVRSISSLQDVEICGVEKTTGKTLFKAEILDGKDISVIRNAEFSGVDKKTGKTLFNAKVLEVSEQSKQEKESTGKSDESCKFLLMPRDLVICGIDKKTGASMAWFMRKIDSIEFKRPVPSESPENKIELKFKEAVSKIK